MNGGLATLWVAIALLFVVYFLSGCFTLKFPPTNQDKPLPPDSTTTTTIDTTKGQDLTKPMDSLFDKINQSLIENDPLLDSTYHLGGDLVKNTTLGNDYDSVPVFSTYGNDDVDYYKAKWIKSVDALKEIAAEFNAFKASYKPCASITTTTTTKVNKHDGGAANNSNGNLWGSIGSAITAILAVVAIIMAKNKKST